MDKGEALKLSQEEFLQKMQTSIDGLSSQEAEKRLAEYGSNALPKKKTSAFKVLGHQFLNSLIYLLIAATAISYAIQDFTDGTVILAILLINTFLGFYQEYKSEKIVEKLSSYLTKTISLKRGGEIFLLDESQIVPGDVVIVRQGDIVPADLRLFEATDLQVNESQLTGESLPISKAVNELIFAGSTIEKGEGIGVIYATGKNSEFGQIAKLATETTKQTEYEKSLKSFSLFLIQIALIGIGLIFAAKLLLNGGVTPIAGLLLFVISMAVAVVPEALPVVATVSLTRGSLGLAKKHVVVKNLSSVEDLGNVNILCTDKTGTITENKMAVHHLASSDEGLFQKFILAAARPIQGKKHKAQSAFDDPFLSYVSAPLAEEAKSLTIVKELPFDPEVRRRRVVLFDAQNQKHYLVVIGAPEVLFELAETDKKSEYLETLHREDSAGLYHIALAYKEIGYDENFDILENENNLSFLGIAGLEDPLRPSAKNTLMQANQLGIQVKILTGDSREMAEYIGKQVGLVSEETPVFLADDLEKMTPEEFQATLVKSHVFARVSPTQKYKIIQTLKEEKNIVAYQGDGINDSPALKLADVSIAVNTATDIAKESSDIVLLNKNLEVIINGIKYGRAVFLNINKYIKFTMISNFGNFITLSVLYLSSVNLPILPIQILLTTIITDLPAIAISTDSVEDGEVVRPEKHNVRELILIALFLGTPTALFEIFYFFIVRLTPQPFLQTQLYVFLTVFGLLPLYVIRNKDHFWRAKRPSPPLNSSFLAVFAFSIGIIYVPVVRDWFSFAPLPLRTLIPIFSLGAIYFFVIDFAKVLYYKFRINAMCEFSKWAKSSMHD